MQCFRPDVGTEFLRVIVRLLVAADSSINSRIAEFGGFESFLSGYSSTFLSSEEKQISQHDVVDCVELMITHLLAENPILLPHFNSHTSDSEHSCNIPLDAAVRVLGLLKFPSSMVVQYVLGLCDSTLDIPGERLSHHIGDAASSVE